VLGVAGNQSQTALSLGRRHYAPADGEKESDLSNTLKRAAGIPPVSPAPANAVDAAWVSFDYAASMPMQEWPFRWGSQPWWITRELPHEMFLAWRSFSRETRVVLKLKKNEFVISGSFGKTAVSCIPKKRRDLELSAGADWENYQGGFMNRDRARHRGRENRLHLPGLSLDWFHHYRGGRNHVYNLSQEKW
jgi:hypothetical protein